jgi:hypothetical protein
VRVQPSGQSLDCRQADFADPTGLKKLGVEKIPPPGGRGDTELRAATIPTLER